jgi:hypothetical protein
MIGTSRLQHLILSLLYHVAEKLRKDIVIAVLKSRVFDTCSLLPQAAKFYIFTLSLTFDTTILTIIVFWKICNKMSYNICQVDILRLISLKI